MPNLRLIWPDEYWSCCSGFSQNDQCKTLNSVYKIHSINAVNDFTGFADHSAVGGIPVIDQEGLADLFIDHLNVADKCNYSLKGKKTFFGYPEAKSWGNVFG